MKRIAMTVIASLWLAASSYAPADDAHHKKEAGLTAGLVKKIDKDAGKISIAHEPIENLGMPKMTMVFRVTEPAMLERVKEGDKIKFAADKIRGTYTVTRIEAAK